MCDLDLSGAACSPYPPEKCQCVYNKTTGNVHFVINGTARPDQNYSIIRAVWEHENHTKVYSNKNYTVPKPKGKLTCCNVMLL